jgi:hypothetical protein
MKPFSTLRSHHRNIFMSKILQFIFKACLLGFMATRAINGVCASEKIFKKTLPNGQTFELSYNQTSALVTNLEAIDPSGKMNQQMLLTLGSNILRQLNQTGPPLEAHTFEAVGQLIIHSHKKTIWTNRGTWNTPPLGLRTGFEFFDVASDPEGFVFCYKEQFELFAEKLSLPGKSLAGTKRSRQKIFSDSPASGQYITNAVFVTSNGLPVRLIATGRLPVSEISWTNHAGKWLQETQTTTSPQSSSPLSVRQESWIWKDGCWVLQP